MTGDDALRAIRVADLILRDLRSHQWEGLAEGPTGPHQIPLPASTSGHALRGPISWRTRATRQGSSTPSER